MRPSAIATSTSSHSRVKAREDARALDHEVGLDVAARDVDQAAAADSLEHQRPPSTMSSGRTGTRASARPVAARTAARPPASTRSSAARRRPSRRTARAGRRARAPRMRIGRHVEDGRDQVVGERRVARRAPSTTWISSISARPRPWAMPPSIWPSTACGLSALPTSCAVAISTTRTSPSSASTSTTARCAANANGHVRVALAGLGVERAGRAVVVLDGLLDRRRRRAARRGRSRRAVDAPHLAAGQLELAVAEALGASSSTRSRTASHAT